MELDYPNTASRWVEQEDASTAPLDDTVDYPSSKWMNGMCNKVRGYASQSLVEQSKKDVVRDTNLHELSCWSSLISTVIAFGINLRLLFFLL
jgi:hypothetical protein